MKGRTPGKQPKWIAATHEVSGEKELPLDTYLVTEASGGDSGTGGAGSLTAGQGWATTTSSCGCRTLRCWWRPGASLGCTGSRWTLMGAGSVPARPERTGGSGNVSRVPYCSVPATDSEVAYDCHRTDATSRLALLCFVRGRT